MGIIIKESKYENSKEYNKEGEINKEWKGVLEKMEGRKRKIKKKERMKKDCIPNSNRY